LNGGRALLDRNSGPRHIGNRLTAGRDRWVVEDNFAFAQLGGGSAARETRTKIIDKALRLRGVASRKDCER